MRRPCLYALGIPREFIWGLHQYHATYCQCSVSEFILHGDAFFSLLFIIVWDVCMLFTDQTILISNGSFMRPAANIIQFSWQRWHT